MQKYFQFTQTLRNGNKVIGYQLVKPILLEDATKSYQVLKVHLISINIPQYCINDDDFHILSTYQNNLADDLGVKVGGEKLCLTLEDKKKYICHYQNLKLYLEKGLKLKTYFMD